MENAFNNKNREYTIEDLEELLDNIPFEVWIKNEEGKYKYINKICAERMGKKKEDVICKTDFDFRPYGMAVECKRGDNKVLLNSKIRVMNEEKVIIDNEERWYETYKLCFNKKGDSENKKLIGGIAREISVDKSLQKGIINCFFGSLHNVEEFDIYDMESKIIKQLKDRLLAKEIAVYLYNPKENKMIFDIQTGTDTSEFENEYFVNTSMSEMLSNNQYNPIIKDNMKTYVYPLKIYDNILGAIEIHYENMLDYYQENIIKYTCLVMSVMFDNRRMSMSLQKELRERKAVQKKLQKVINTGIDAYGLLYDKDNIREWLEMSRPCKEIFGWDCESLNKFGILDNVYPDDRDKLAKLLDENVREVRDFQCRLLCKNGECKYVNLNWSFIDDSRCIVTAKDVTRENELKIDKEDLQEAVELESLKTEFFANISHEFKTPLNIIISALQVLDYSINQTDIEPAKLNQYISAIKQNSYRLLKLANNMIDITKIDGGFYEVEIDNYNIVEVVENIVLSVAGYMKNNKRNITFDTTEEEIITACDIDQIERIILNLLSNSLKFTSANGNIYVNMSVSSDCSKVIIKVRNDGDPISKEFAKKIFKRFTQSENLLTRSNEGSGIGLSLVKSLVEIHNGKIYVNTEIEDGTEFCIEIPIRKLMNSKNKNVINRNINSKVQKYKVEFSDIYSLE